MIDLDRDGNGKRRQKWVTVNGTKRDAERKAAEIVQQTLHWVHGGWGLVFHPPKSRKGERSVALSSTSVLLLRSHRERQEAERIPGELQQGRSQRPRVHPLQWATDVAGDRQPHLRQDRPQGGLSPPPAPRSPTHARATLVLQQGVHLKVVQERLGHATISTTSDIYSHVFPGIQEAAAARFDDELSGV